MSAGQTVTTIRNLQDFNRLEVWDPANWVELVITSGEKESLTIQGPAEIVSRIKTGVKDGTLVITLGGTILDKIKDALTTSLTRKKVTYHLTVRQLDEVSLRGLISVDTSCLETSKPDIRRMAPGLFPMRIFPPIAGSPPGRVER